MTQNEKHNPKKINNQHTNGRPRHQWSIEEKRAIAADAYPLIETQKSFGKSKEPSKILQGWENKLAGRFSVNQILYALDLYTDENNDFPTPSEIIKILNPAPPKVTQSEYIAAKEWQKRNNKYDSFTDAHNTIKAYEAQGAAEKSAHKIQCEKLKAVAGGTFKKIEG